MQFKNVRTLFLTVLLPLFIISFIVLSGATYYIASNALNNDAVKIAQSVSQQTAAKIQVEVNSTLLPLKTASRNSAFTFGDKTTQLQALKEIKTDADSVAQTFYCTLDGKTLRDDGTYLERGNREYVKKVKNTGKPYIAKPFMGSTSKKLMTMIVQPVFTNGKLTGMLMASINIEDLAKNTDELKTSENGYTFITDESGLVIGYEKSPELVGKMNLTKPAIEDTNEKVDVRLTTAFNNAIASNAQSFTNFSLPDGTESIATITPFELAGNTWVVVTAAPSNEANAPARMLLKILAGISLFILLLAIFVILYFSKTFSRPLTLLRDECNTLNDGNLAETNFSLNRKDELGELAQGFSRMRKTLRTLVQKVQSQSEQVAAASEELTASSQQSADSSNHIAGSISAIASGINDQAQAANQIHDISENISNHANEIASKTLKIANDAKATTAHIDSGRDSITKVVEQMEQITDSTNSVESSIQKLADGSEKIVSIVELISNIAGQTNLLALNAAIEAARAGEAGRGFSVVAEEVRKLAESSKSSSQQIAELVKKNQLDMNTAVEASQHGSNSVKVGIETVKSADEVFKSIVIAIEALTTEITNVSTAIQQMANENASMMASIVNIDKISKKNAVESQSVSAATQEQSSSMQEIATASHNLAQLASNLQSEVEKFKV
ncbi:MAG: methyl-accepting chemotaxis protein [Selenomonadaceae bacterium]